MSLHATAGHNDHVLTHRRIYYIATLAVMIDFSDLSLSFLPLFLVLSPFFLSPLLSPPCWLGWIDKILSFIDDRALCFIATDHVPSAFSAVRLSRVPAPQPEPADANTPLVTHEYGADAHGLRKQKFDKESEIVPNGCLLSSSETEMAYTA